MTEVQKFYEECVYYRLLGNFPNTYIFTKSTAEGVLNDKAKDLPLSIFRFPIALAIYKEPFPGWIDTFQGFNQAIVGIGIGAITLRTKGFRLQYALIATAYGTLLLITYFINL